MHIRRLDTRGTKERRAFINFPLDLYQGHDCWVPPLVMGVRGAMNHERHPFYRHSDADFFMAEEDGRVLGRIAVLANRRYNDFHDSRVAFFYYFDAVDEAKVARGLFDAAAAWARARDLKTLIGPKGFLRSDGIGLLIDGFEHRAAPGIPYNYPYYHDLMTSAGFEKEIDYHSGYVAGDYRLPERIERIAAHIRERRGFWVQNFTNKRELRAWIPAIQRINNEAFTEVWGYYPMDEAETAMVGRQLLTLADPRMLKLVMKGDKVAGFAFVFPDVSRALQKAGGRLWPLGWIHLLWAFRHTRRLSANGLGLLPKYQGLGANAVLYSELINIIRTREVELCDVAQVAETNRKSMGDMLAAGLNWYKTHRVYRKAV